MSEETDNIKQLLEQVRLYKNPEELEDIKKQIKKSVPFSMRGYFMAYLYLQQNSAPQKRPEKGAERPKKSLDNTTAFYINVGKYSKITGRELGNFICQTAGLETEELVAIVFKQNYSFFYVKQEKAGGVVEALNGKFLNDKKIKVNYGKEKDEE